MAASKSGAFHQVGDKVSKPTIFSGEENRNVRSPPKLSTTRLSRRRRRWPPFAAKVWVYILNLDLKHRGLSGHRKRRKQTLAVGLKANSGKALRNI